MEELQVLVQQQPGVIKWNFQDLKNALQQEMTTYSNLVYTDDTIVTAKKDLATLRKLRTAVEDKRKEIKKKCLEPYSIIEEQAKELTGLIDEPIKLISDQTEDYENRRRAAVKKKIMAYMTETFSVLPADIAKKAQFKFYDSRWENKTASETEWQNAISHARDEITASLQIIQATDPDFRDEAYNIFSRDLSLTDAMAKVQELQRQREMILEQQRRKEEAERARREAEAARAQKIAEEAAKAAPQENHAPATQKIEEPQNQPAAPRSPMGQVVDSIDRESFNTLKRADDAAPRPAAVIQLYDATDAQVRKILDYIKFMGVKFEARR